jgi:hypothetical protein
MGKTWNITPTSTPSLATAAAQAQPGDTISLSGTFKNVSLVPKVSGTATAEITYESASPGAATFDGAGPSGVAAISGRSHIVIDGIKFTNSAYKTAPVANKGIVLRGSSHITIQNCTMNYMQMLLIGSSDNKILDNVWREFIAIYLSGKPQTAGDMLNLINGSHRNLIQGNDMKYAGHSLIEVGNGFGGQNAANQILNNTLSNPWYKCLILADDGAGTIADGNDLLDSNSVPTLYSTIAGQVGQLQMADAALQLSGSNFIVRNNLIQNAVGNYGVVTLGARWYSDPLHPFVLVQSLDNQIYGNQIVGNKGAAAISFVVFLTPADVSAGRQVPNLTGNDIHDNVIGGSGLNANSGTPYSQFPNAYTTFLYHSATVAPLWSGLNGNMIHANEIDAATNAHLIDGVFQGGVNVHSVKSLAQFQALDPSHVYGNSVAP